MTVNRDGFLGPDLRPGSGPRVVVYGDSFVASEFSPVEERFVTRLGLRLTEEGGAPVEAINAGVVGYGPDQSVLRLEDEIGPLQPDLVVVAVFAGNDFGDLVRNRLFRLDEEGRLAPRAPQLSARLRAEFTRAARQAEGSMLLGGLRELLARPVPEERRLLPAGGFRYLRDRRFREFSLSLPSGSDEVEHLFGDPYDADLSLAPESASARYKRDLMEGVLARLADTAARHQTPIVFLLIPSAYDTAPHFDHPDPAEFPEYRPSALTDALAIAATRRGLAFLDLFPVFHASARPLYLRADEHWNAAGQALAADQLAALVRSRGLLPPAQR